MIRIIRTATLHRLQADAATAAEARQEAVEHATEAEGLRCRYAEANTAYEKTFKDLGKALADVVQAQRERNEARDQREQDKAETEKQLAELREDLAKIQAAAADPDTGETVRAALAHNILRDLYADAWKEGLLPKRPFDLIAAVLGFDKPQQPQPEATPTA